MRDEHDADHAAFLFRGRSFRAHGVSDGRRDENPDGGAKKPSRASTVMITNLPRHTLFRRSHMALGLTFISQDREFACMILAQAGRQVRYLVSGLFFDKPKSAVL
ncbi:hypothetical protein [Aquamicrobium sp. LC103]|uniref:hypothetical protein n=1 Tax=Aquamicrobium sp. LC103 TaxID=1120658 RepID=UPI0010C9E20C|nr:hypothetical protein [Aquamicrobium sp. LC103]